MAGFKKIHIEGYPLKADPDIVRLLKREFAGNVGRIFRDARDHGQMRVILADQPYILHANTDHVFTIEKENAGHGIV